MYARVRVPSARPPPPGSRSGVEVHGEHGRLRGLGLGRERRGGPECRRRPPGCPQAASASMAACGGGDALHNALRSRHTVAVPATPVNEPIGVAPFFSW